MGFLDLKVAVAFFSLSMVQFELINNTSRPMEKLPQFQPRGGQCRQSWPKPRWSGPVRTWAFGNTMGALEWPPGALAVFLKKTRNFDANYVHAEG